MTDIFKKLGSRLLIVLIVAAFCFLYGIATYAKDLQTLGGSGALMGSSDEYSATGSLTPISEPLTFTANVDNALVTFYKEGSIDIQYRIDGGDWSPFTAGIEGIRIDKGHSISFMGKNPGGFSKEYNLSHFKFLSSFEVSGNIMSLVADENGEFADIKEIPCNYCFAKLFDQSYYLTKADELLLPATTLKPYCYYNMFVDCTGMTAGPELPATNLTDHCYRGMFQHCVSMTEGPSILPATVAKQYCYDDMFYQCYALEKAPEIKATTLADYSCSDMFAECKSLKTAPALPATTLAEDCYYDMFKECTSLKTAPALPATILAPECYERMFDQCSKLTKAPEIKATTLAPRCCYEMFLSCTSLEKAPDLPATTLANSCYTSMFEHCISLEKAPELPATTLSTSCYEDMFKDCTSLKVVPDLPATVLADSCYRGMYHSCSNIVNVPVIQGENFPDYCCYEMFRDCLKMEIYTDSGTDHPCPWSMNDAEEGDYWNYDMFDGTGGTLDYYPNPGKTYYINGATVTFDSNGGSEVEAQVLKLGEKIEKPANDPEKADASFAGWYKDEDCEYHKWNFSQDVVTGSMTLYAKWIDKPEPQVIAYTVSFDANGYGTAPAAQSVESGKLVTEPKSPTADEFVLTGWYKEKECITPWDFAADQVTADITLYAKWIQRNDVEACIVTFDKTEFNYNGKKQIPTVVSVKTYDGAATLTKDVDYRIVAPKQSTLVGGYVLTIVGKGAYNGGKLCDYTIDPPAKAIKSLVRGKKQFTVKWTKLASKYAKEASGLEIRYATKKNFAGAKTVKVSKTATKKVIKKLKSKKTYYVQMRTYKNVGKRIYYSNWSAKKNIKTK